MPLPDLKPGQPFSFSVDVPMIGAINITVTKDAQTITVAVASMILSDKIVLQRPAAAAFLEDLVKWVRI